MKGIKSIQDYFFRRAGFLASLLAFLAVVGPGIITSNVDNDAGGISTYSIAGAHFGYALLWSMIPILVILIIIQEMSARLGVVTGKGLSDLIREKFGLRTTFYLFLALFITNLGNVMAEFSGVAASLEIFGVSKYISVPIGAIFVWWLVVKGNYKTVERVFLGACVFYITYIVSGFLAKPDWGNALVATVKPTFHFETGYLVMLVGLVGTTIAPWMQFYLQASVVEKGIKVEEYKHSRLDVIVGSIVVMIVAFFIIVACAATLFKAGIRIESAKDAALALRPLAGKYCAALFAFGLLNASLFAASILPLSTAYTICEGMGFESGLDRRFRDAPQFYGLYTALIVVGAGVVLIPGFPLLTVMVASQVVNGILLPFVLIFMLSLINRKDLMGNYKNSKTFNIIAWATVIGLIVLNLFMLITFVLPSAGLKALP
jgi:NRAMP (natural resistance-associated macrophage protein)-like metal ion transporter